MTVRAKFRCISTTNREEGGSVYLEPVTSDNNEEENEQFFKYTPWGKLEMGIVNSGAFSQFQPGEEYYIDFSPAKAG